MIYYWLGAIETSSIAEIGSISDDLKGAIITTCVTGIISIIGFVVTNVSMNKNFKNELKKQRNSVALEKMTTMPFEVLKLMDEMIDSTKAGGNSQKKNINMNSVKNFNMIINTIYSYGSEESIKIVALMQKENYASTRKTENIDKHRAISLYVLLATQIKYDVTEISVSPELWFQMRLTDYEVMKPGIKMQTNKLIEELELRREFLIK